MGRKNRNTPRRDYRPSNKIDEVWTFTSRDPEPVTTEVTVLRPPQGTRSESAPRKGKVKYFSWSTPSSADIKKVAIDVFGDVYFCAGKAR